MHVHMRTESGLENTGPNVQAESNKEKVLSSCDLSTRKDNRRIVIIIIRLFFFTFMLKKKNWAPEPDTIFKLLLWCVFSRLDWTWTCFIWTHKIPVNTNLPFGKTFQWLQEVGRCTNLYSRHNISIHGFNKNEISNLEKTSIHVVFQASGKNTPCIGQRSSQGTHAPFSCTLT